MANGGLVNVAPNGKLLMIYRRCIHGRRCIHRHHAKRVGSIGLFLNLSKSGFVHGVHGD